MGQSEVRWCDRCSHLLLNERRVTVDSFSYSLCETCAAWLVDQLPYKDRFVAVAKERA